MEETTEDECVWVGPVNAAYLSGYDKKAIRDVTAGDCMKACEQEVTFTCVSFDYIYNSRMCYLSDRDRTQSKLSASASYQYYERNCDSKQALF